MTTFKNSTAIMTLMLLGATSVCAQGAQPVEMEIEAQSLSTALAKLSDLTQTQFIYAPEQLEGIKGIGLKGRYDSASALKKLIGKSNLEFEKVDETTYIIRAKAASQSAAITAPEANGQENVFVLEEIVVTAQKREQRLQDVPMSIVALGADELREKNIVSLEDIGLAVPGLTVIDNGGWNSNIFIRGIGNISGNRPLIGLYVDDAPVSSNTQYAQPDLQLFDLARVEILRGPQGTMYGQGSAGGTLRFITNAPDLDEFSFSSDFAASFTKGGTPAQRVQSVVNIPISDDYLGIRLAGVFDSGGGWIDQPAAHRNDINGQNLVNVRASVLWKPTDRMDVSASMTIHHNDRGPTYESDQNADGIFTQPFGKQTTPSSQENYEIYNATIKYDLGGAELISASSYIRSEKDRREIGERLPPLGLDAIYLFRDTENKTFSQEVRLTSSNDNAFQWLFGGFYENSTGLFDGNADVGSYDDDDISFLFTAFSDTSSKAWAVFGNASLELFERVEIGAGLRYFKDNQKDASDPTVQAETFNTLSPRAYLRYDVNEAVNVYASVAKGFRSGGFNTGRGDGFPPFGPESVWTYELGSKAVVANGRLSFEVAAFKSDYTDFIINGFPDDSDILIAFSLNAGDVKITGAEAAVSWQITNKFKISADASYMDTKFDRIAASQTFVVVGDRVPFIPRYQFAFSAEQELAIAGRPSYLRVDYNRRDKTTSESPTSSTYGESGVIDMVNASFSVNLRDNLTFGIFADNLLNERDFLDPQYQVGIAGRPRPRTFGFKLSLDIN